MKHNSGRNPKTMVECRVTCPAPHSRAVFDFATDRVLVKAAKASPGYEATHNKAMGSSRYHNIGHSPRGQVPSKQTANRTVHLLDQQGIFSQSTPLLGIPTVESAVCAPNERGRILLLRSAYFLHLVHRFDARHELEGVMADVVSTDIALEGRFLSHDTRSMVHQLKIKIARPAVDSALVLAYEDMHTGKSSKLSRSWCLQLGGKEIPRVRLLAGGKVPQIRPMGGLEGQWVMLTSGPSICQRRTRNSRIAVVELTSSRVDSLPPGVGDRNPPSKDDCADVVDARTEGVSVNDLEIVRWRVGLESTEVLMHVLSIGDRAR